MPSDAQWMERAVSLALRGEGHVEPNPMVGCVLVRDDQLLAEGFHARYGGPHAERAALADLNGQSARGATAYVTLEPCCHHGKTPPCTEALIAAGICRVCCAMLDPFPAVSGKGVEQLRAAGVKVEVGCGQEHAGGLVRPYLKRTMRGLPFVIAKWAMSLDGKIATATGDSRWISSASSREHLHRIRGRMDAIIVGSRTARIDDPLLTARPPGPRVPVRVVMDSHAELSVTSQLVRTAKEIPVLVWCGPDAQSENVSRLRVAGCQVEIGSDRDQRIAELLRFLAEQHSATNAMFEGGGQLLGHLFDQDLVDEVQVYIAPKLIGGAGAIVPLAARGLSEVVAGPKLIVHERATFEEDIFVRARLCRPELC